MLLYQKTMCLIVSIAKSQLSLENFGKRFKSHFLYYYNGEQRHEGLLGFENACSRAKTYVILTSQCYVYFYASYC